MIIQTGDAIQNLIELDKALSVGGDVQLPPGIFHVFATGQNRFARIMKSSFLRSTGQKTIIKMIGNSGGTDFNHPNHKWAVFNSILTDHEFELAPNIEFEGPDYIDPLNPPVTIPRVFIAEGNPWTTNPPCKRRFYFPRFVVKGNSFGEAIFISGDAAIPPPGNFTDLQIDSAFIHVYLSGIGVFGTQKRARLNNVDMIAGTYHTNAAHGDCVYVHQGVDFSIDNFDITHPYGRACIKYAGTKSEGSAPLGRISNGICRTGIPGFGTGIGLDKFTDTQISNVTFEALWIGIQMYGKCQTNNCIFNCKNAFGVTGSLTNSDPVRISANADRFIGCDKIWDGPLEKAHIYFNDFYAYVNNNKAQLFSLPKTVEKSKSMNMVFNNGMIVADDCEFIFNPAVGEWEGENIQIICKNAKRGIFNNGCEPMGRAIFRKTKKVYDPSIEFYSGISQANKERVVFE